MSCSVCRHARLVYNEDARRDFVGCLYYNIDDAKALLRALEENDYIFEEDFVRMGWAYLYVPPDKSPQDYDTADGHLLANNCLITGRNAVCGRFS